MTNPTTVLGDFAGQNWMIIPAALAVGESPPATIHDQKWLLVMTGIVEADLSGDSTWLNRSVSFLPSNSLSLAGPGHNTDTGPLNWAINNYPMFTRPSSDPSDYDLAFSIVGWAPFVGLSAIFDAHQSIDAGFAVNFWRPTHFKHGFHYPDVSRPLNNVFSGITVDVGVSDTDASILKLSYHITLVGTIAFAATNSLID